MRIRFLAGSGMFAAAASLAAAQGVTSFGRPEAGACTLPPGMAGPAAYLEPVGDPGARDTTVTVRACLHGGPARVGSFHATITWDANAARLTEVARPRFGTVLHNVRRPGDVTFAGASPAGFENGPVLQLTLRLERAGKPPRFELLLSELNSTEPRALVATSSVTGWPRGRAPLRPSRSVEKAGDVAYRPAMPKSAPVIETVTPRRVLLDAAEPPVIEIRGRDFAPEGNTIVFGPARIGGVAAANDGTLLRFVLPRALPLGGEAPPMTLTSGTHRLSVRTARGESNVVELVVQ